MYYAGEIVEEVRERCDIVDLIGSYVKLKRQGCNPIGKIEFLKSFEIVNCVIVAVLQEDLSESIVTDELT